MTSEEERDEQIKQERLKERPEWDVYYLAQAFVAASRSFDPSSRCGCVLVSKDNRPLSTGYNAPIKGSNDALIPVTRPHKYYHMIHAEENALLSYGGSHQDLRGATAYVTGRPCHRCLRGLLQKGVTEIVYGDNITKVVEDSEEGKLDLDAQAIMLGDHPDVVMEKRNCDEVIKVLESTIAYIKMKQQQAKEKEEDAGNSDN